MARCRAEATVAGGIGRYPPRGGIRWYIGRIDKSLEARSPFSERATACTRHSRESNVRAVMEQTSVIVHEITLEIAALATAFGDDFPADPADRLVGATARSMGLPLVTHDQRILGSGLLKTIW